MMLNIYSEKMISAEALASAESLVWVVALVKKKVDATFCGTISVHIMRSQPADIHDRMKRILEVKFDQKDQAKHSR